MVNFVPVDPEDVPNIREGRRGRVSYPILKSFMETGMVVAMLDRTGIQQSHQSLYSSLNNYIRSHDMPIKIFSRGGNIYLMRLDLDDEGNAIDWDTGDDDEEIWQDAKPIDAGEVQRRYEEERDATTK